METKEVVLGKDKFLIKKLTPLDFIEDPEGVPFNFIVTKKILTMHEKMVQDLEEEDPKQDSDNLAKIIKEVLSRSVILHGGGLFEFSSEYAAKNPDTVLWLTNEVLLFSLEKFPTVIEVSDYQLSFFGVQAQRYSKTPIEILFPNGGYSELDAHFFNSAVTVYMLQKESEDYKKLEAKMKRGKR